MTSTLNKISPVLAELKIEVSTEDVTKALNTAYSTVSRTAKVSGFRKGKVPKGVIHRLYGQAVRADVAQELISTHSQTAFIEHEMMPIAQPKIDADPVKEGEPFSFTVNFETRPKLEGINYDEIEIERYKVEVADDMVEKELAMLRSGMGEAFDLDEPRPAADGDLLKVEIQRWDNEEWKEIPGQQDVVVGDGRTIKELEAGLLGMNVDDEKVIDLASETEENRTRLLVKVASIQGRKLPELDDELAKDVGDFETLDALKKDINERLVKAASGNEDNRVKHALFDALREKNPMESPPSLVQQQAFSLQMQIMQSMQQMGRNPEDDKAREELVANAQKTAEQMVHQQLLLMEVARLEDLEVGDEDVDKHVENTSEETGIPVPMIRAEFQKEGRMDELRHQLLEKKVFDFAQTKVKITETDAPAVENDQDGK